MKNIGLHIRFKDRFLETVEKALALNVPIFQCFLTDYVHKKHIEPSSLLVGSFKKMTKTFKEMYAHGSYLVNLADERDHYILKRELDLSKRLGFRYLILHPGAFKKSTQNLMQGIDCVVKNINLLMKNESDVILILENTAFGGNVIGGDLLHFESIFNRLDFPERVRLCIDTAHAYAYGYDLNNFFTHESFLTLLKSLIIADFIQLLHLNNTSQELGSKMDTHSILFEGNIASDTLKNVALDPLFQQADIIVEMPECPQEIQKNILINISNWF